MRRDMQEVLERWGRWAASEEYCSLVDWPAMSVTPYCKKQEAGKPKCSDEDGITIDTCVAHMVSTLPTDDALILGQRFIGGLSTRFIAEVMQRDRHSVRTSLRASEAFLEGVLVAFNIRLDMDYEVARSEKVVGAQKPVLLF